MFDAAEEMLRLGHKQKGRKERIAAIQAELAAAARLGGEPLRPLRLAAAGQLLAGRADRGDRAQRPLPRRRRPRAGRHRPRRDAASRPERGATLVTIYAKDQPGLFYRLAGAISLAGGNIIDARIHTTDDGMALDNFLVQDLGRAAVRRPAPAQAARGRGRCGALAGHEPRRDRLAARALPLRRAEAFRIQPAVFIDNKASNRYTVVEVNARDRAALLFELAQAIYVSRALIHSAHIATYGERAVDVFYLTDLAGAKIESPARLKALQARLLEASAPRRPRRPPGGLSRPKERAPAVAGEGPVPSVAPLRSGSGR